MRAFTLESLDGDPTLRDGVAEPTAAANEVVVRVHASSINPVDAFIAMGALKEMVEHDFPVTLGRDFAGVVEETGDGVSRYRVGDAVFGFVPYANPTVRDGSWAELIVLPEDDFATSKPSGVDLAGAGAAAVAGLTAVAAFDALALSEGDKVVVIGATGGVGSLFVQLAASAGAHVIATALAEDHDYLQGLGVAELLDRNGDVAAAVRKAHPDGVDALLDVVSQAPDASLLAAGGRLASPLGAAGEGRERFNVMAEPSPANLQRLGDSAQAAPSSAGPSEPASEPSLKSRAVARAMAVRRRTSARASLRFTLT